MPMSFERAVTEVETEAAIVDPDAPPPPDDEDIDDANEMADVLLEGRVGGDELDLEGKGTSLSATFNLLSTMVGGGSLSLPLACFQTGLGFFGPLLLLVVGAASHFSMTALVDATTLLDLRKLRRINLLEGGDVQTNTESSPKADYYSYEAVVSAAFGKGRYATMALVAFICYFSTVGYAVLLRDLLSPLVDSFVPPPASAQDDDSPPTAAHNMALLVIVLLVTPLCTLKTLTSLQKVGAASMVSVLILGACITFRSIQCNSGSGAVRFRFFPESLSSLLKALPIVISCYLCHYNIPPVYGELKKPVTESSVLNRWLYATSGSAIIFYLFMGIAGGLYSNCTDGTLHSNVLLDLPADDPLLLLGRACLGVTLTLAFPMLVIPGRDIAIRLKDSRISADDVTVTTDPQSSTSENSSWSMRQPLLTGDNSEPSANATELSTPAVDDATQETPSALEADDVASASSDDLHFDEVVNPQTNTSSSTATTSPFLLRAGIALIIFWSAAALACCVKSIDIVWDLLGSSLSLSLGFLLPPAAYVCIAKMSFADAEPCTQVQIDALRRIPTMRVLAWIELICFIPIMLICSCNSVYDTFFARAL